MQYEHHITLYYIIYIKNISANKVNCKVLNKTKKCITPNSACCKSLYCNFVFADQMQTLLLLL